MEKLWEADETEANGWLCTAKDVSEARRYVIRATDEHLAQVEHEIALK